MRGMEWIVDARGCDAAALADAHRLQALFDAIIRELDLTPVAGPVWHRFPSPGGFTGFVVLAESHLACHSFPEFGAICVNVFCCRKRPAFDAQALLTSMLGASEVSVRVVERDYAPVPEVKA